MELNFMLIDDSKLDLFVNQKIIESVLDESNIRKFDDPISALKFLKVLNKNINGEIMLLPDVILLDINMPNMNGFQLLKALNELENINKTSMNIYILSSSAYSGDELKAKTLRSNVGFIQKPLTKQSLNKVMIDMNINYRSMFNEDHFFSGNADLAV